MKKNTRKINVGIGFVTGRKNFKKVVKSYLRSFSVSEHLNPEMYALHLFVAYDLKYKGTKVSDYQITDGELLEVVDTVHYLGPAAISTEVNELIEDKVITGKEAKAVFGEGYAMKRNAVLYFALKYKMDCIIFLDDDEYPVANVRLGDGMAWKGQEVLSTHIDGIQHADMTHGYHCGYISPIPQLQFNEILTEQEFQIFIEAISNDIITWDSIKAKMADGGITYADTQVMNSPKEKWVENLGGMKFVSGANLAINLKDTNKVFPFYNPPGARGEDTFLSTCIDSCRVLKVGCYTFHDAFSAYDQILGGVLPESLKVIDGRQKAISKRFQQAAVGWIRYKPLLVYITQPQEYLQQMADIESALIEVLPKLSMYFEGSDFQIILKEFYHYRDHVAEHFADFEHTKKAWGSIMTSFKKTNQGK